VHRGAASAHRGPASLTTRACVWTHRCIVTDDPTDCENTDRSSPLTPGPSSLTIGPIVTDDEPLRQQPLPHVSARICHRH
jgi:hypothetical protein